MCTVSQTHLLLLLRSLRSLLPVASLLLLRHHPTTAQSSHSPRPSYHCAIRTPYQHHPSMPRHSIASKHHFHSLTQSTATSGRRRQGPIPCPCTTRKTLAFDFLSRLRITARDARLPYGGTVFCWPASTPKHY
ncbi:hypothetical protein HDK77DRAFT_316302 [Phyllosticta capitalensis]